MMCIPLSVFSIHLTLSHTHTFFNQIQSIRGIATSDSESTNSVLAKVELDESDSRKVESDEDEDIISHRKLEKTSMKMKIAGMKKTRIAGIIQMMLLISMKTRKTQTMLNLRCLVMNS